MRDILRSVIVAALVAALTAVALHVFLPQPRLCTYYPNLRMTDCY